MNTKAGSPRLELMAQAADDKRLEALNDKITHYQELARLADDAGHNILAERWRCAIARLSMPGYRG